MSIIIQNITIWNPDEAPKKGDLSIENGVFVESIHQDEQATVIDGQSSIAMPGFVDVHIHGAMGGDVMDATVDALETISAALVQEGTTAFLATTMTQSEHNIELALKNAANFKGEYSQMVGIHLEGPFVNKVRAGAQPIQSIRFFSITKALS